MKTVKSIKTQKRYTNSEFLDLLRTNPVCAGRAEIVGRKKAERIVFPETQDGGYVLSVKCSKKINVYLGEYAPPNPKRAVFEGYYSDITYWGDWRKRKNLYEKISLVAEEIAKMLTPVTE